MHVTVFVPEEPAAISYGRLGAEMNLAGKLEKFHAELLYIKFALGAGAVRYERALLHRKIVPKCSINTLLRGD